MAATEFRPGRLAHRIARAATTGLADAEDREYSGARTAQEAIERIANRRPKALGLALELRGSSLARSRTDDARLARLEALAIAVPDEQREGPGSASVLTLERELIAELDAAGELAGLLAPLWSGAAPPYLVFADAQLALTVLGARGLPTPARFGCAMVAATLLAEGADRRRDHRPLDRLARELLEHDLPDELPLASSPSHDWLARPRRSSSCCA